MRRPGEVVRAAICWVDTIVLPWVFNTDSKQYTVNIPIVNPLVCPHLNITQTSILATEPSLVCSGPPRTSNRK